MSEEESSQVNFNKMQPTKKRVHTISIRVNDEELAWIDGFRGASNGLATQMPFSKKYVNLKTTRGGFLREWIFQKMKAYESHHGAINMPADEREKLLGLLSQIFNKENDILSALNRMGNNMNQLARLSNYNQNADSVRPADLAEVIQLMNLFSDDIYKFDGGLTDTWRRLE